MTVLEKILLTQYMQFKEKNYDATPVHVVMNLPTYKQYARDIKETYPAYYVPRGLRDPAIPITISPFVNVGMIIFSIERN